MKRIISVAFFCVMLGFLYGQSIVELSRQEKARRESCKDNRGKVVTNADLATVHKRPAIIAPSQDSQADEIPEASSSLDHQDGGASSVIRMTPTVTKDGPPLLNDGEPADASISSGDLESRLKAAVDFVELLTTKLKGLQQEFYSLNTMTPGDVIQQKIAETYEKLQKAQDAVTRLQDQINKCSSSRSEAGSLGRRPY